MFKTEQAAEGKMHSAIHEAFTDAHGRRVEMHASTTELSAKAILGSLQTTFTKALSQDCWQHSTLQLQHLGIGPS